MKNASRGSLIFLLIFFLTATGSSFALSYGHLKGRVQNESGHPLPDILVTLLRKSSSAVLPVLARTDNAGAIFLRNIEAGDYELKVKSANYQSTPSPLIEVEPGQTAVFTLVLETLFRLGDSSGVNLSLKSLFRTSVDRRLVFRGLPGVMEDPDRHRPFGPLFENAVFQVYNNAGLGGDYLVFPGDSSSGTTTNFAFSDSLSGNSSYIFAGQLNSGEDSLWRLKNFVDYQLSDHHSLRLFLGYGRMSFDQPSLALMGNPAAIGNNLDFISALGAVKTLSLGVEDTLRWGDMLALVWGLELNQVRTAQTYSFANPSAEISFSPLRRTTLRARMASKRSTHGNTLQLPQTGAINLSDAVHFSQVGDRFTLGTARFYQASIIQQVGHDMEFELATYRNQLFGGSVPFLAILEYRPGYEIFHLDGDQAGNRGSRVTLHRTFGENLKTAVSYVHASAMGLEPENVAVVLDEAAMRSLISRQSYHGLSTQVEIEIPHSQTRLTLLVKFVPKGHPITTLDTFSDVYETSNKGVNLFIRQIVPVPPALFNFFGLDFLSTYQIEALVDIRNLTNEDLGLVRTALGDAFLLRNPRTLRGGISLKF